LCRLAIAGSVLLVATAMGHKYSIDHAHQRQKREPNLPYETWLAEWRHSGPPDPAVGPQREGEWRWLGAIPMYGNSFYPQPGEPLTSITFGGFPKFQLKPEGLKWLKNEKSLKDVRFVGVLTDKDVEHLKPLNWIERLELINTGITDTGLAELRTLANLRYLDLSGSPVSDQSLEVLVQFPALEHVKFGRTEISHEGFQAFRWRHRDWESTQGMEVRRVAR